MLRKMTLKRISMFVAALAFAAMLVSPAKANAGVAVVVGPVYAHPVAPVYVARPYVAAPVVYPPAPYVYAHVYGPRWGFYPHYRYSWRPVYRGYYGRPYFHRW